MERKAAWGIAVAHVALGLNAVGTDTTPWYDVHCGAIAAVAASAVLVVNKKRTIDSVVHVLCVIVGLAR